jgi:hypothetical protein
MGQGRWGELLNRRYRKMMVLAIGLPLFQMLSGINTVTFYSSEVRFLFLLLHILDGRTDGAGDALIVTRIFCDAADVAVQVFYKAGLHSPIAGSIVVGTVSVAGTLVQLAALFLFAVPHACFSSLRPIARSCPILNADTRAAGGRRLD